MNINSPPGNKSHSFDGLDFTPTDFEEARKALDELPAGVEQSKKFDSAYWVQRRRDIRASDKALTGNTIDWLMKLPPSLRPRELCEAFPRLANLLAGAWADRRTAFAELDNLIADRRGGRRGFPPAVRDELVALREMLLRSSADPS